MKKKVILLTIIIIFLSNSFSSSSYLHKKVIKIAGDNNYPPYEFIDDKGNFRGFNVDMMRAIAIELGLEIELIPMNWQDALDALERGEVDAIQGMTRSKAREEKFDFSLPLVINSQAIFVLKETNYISSIEDLKGRRVSFQKGDISYELSQEVEGIKPYSRTNQEEAIDLLLDGKVDAFIGNRLTGLYYLQKESNFDKVKIVGEPMHETEYCISVLKGNEHLLELFNQGIETIKKNGTYDKIYKKWFGETFVDKSRYFKNLLYISIAILLVVSVVACVNLYWNKNLKKKVEERTRELNTLNEELEEQKREIEKSNMLRGKILESILSGIIVFDNYDRVIEYNKAAEKILNKSLSFKEAWENLNLQEEYGLEGYDIAKQGQVITGNKEIVSNNKKTYINYNFIPVNKLGAGIILLINDLTDIKRYQEMASYNDKMQALGQLAGGIAHEIRNPLTSINTFIDLIPYKLDDEQFKKDLVTITKKEINRMNELISQLIDYTKPVTRQPTSFFIDEVLEEVLILFSNQFKKKRISVVKDIRKLSVFADRNQIKQILVNIILNSIEAMEEGGKIYISSFKGDAEGIIEIKDNGCGIAEAHMDKIFQPFFTLKPNGTGIGLAITKKLVEENEGDIFIESEENNGTKVTVSLPVS
ncbi:MAG: transporter substrate-binding domain-containing protein [Tissierellia bacterium]|nr:transporter substrate-binding domain-containing protein [Tissierellia bacterium]